jgi:hypothetical protein
MREIFRSSYVRIEVVDRAKRSGYRRATERKTGHREQKIKGPPITIPSPHHDDGDKTQKLLQTPRMVEFLDFGVS